MGWKVREYIYGEGIWDFNKLVGCKVFGKIVKKVVLKVVLKVVIKVNEYVGEKVSDKIIEFLYRRKKLLV